MNGVGYDPNSLTSPASTRTASRTSIRRAGASRPHATPKDAYTASKGNSTSLPDTGQEVCNANNVCMRNGQTDALPPTGNAPAVLTTFAYPRFRHRRRRPFHVRGPVSVPHEQVQRELQAGGSRYSDRSNDVFGLPEMMPIGSFARAGSTVTATTVEAHGLTTSDKYT